MPSIENNRAALKEGKEKGYLSYVDFPTTPAPMPPVGDSYPIRMNPYLRVPLPSNFASPTDSLRNFYHPNIPQYRIPGAYPSVLQVGAGSVSQAIVASKGGSSATSQSFGATSTGGDEVGGTIFGGGLKGGPYGKLTSDTVDEGRTFGKVSQNALTNNFVDPSKTGVLSIGSRPQSVTSQPAFVTTTTSITVYWDGTNSSQVLNIYRDDMLIEGPFSGSQAITGLGANCTTPLICYLYQYYDEHDGLVKFASQAGAIGTPAYVYTAVNVLAAQEQIFRGHVLLSPALANPGFSTPAAGTGGGSGGSGGGGGGGGRNIPKT